MSRSNKIPFPRGKTAFASLAASDFDTSSLAHLEGQIVYLPDVDPAGDGKTRRSNTDLVAKVVRNRHSAVLLPGEACQWLTTGWGTSVIEATGQWKYVCGFVDDKVHATNGVPVNDLFYLIIEGPVSVATKNAGVATTGTLYKQGAQAYLSDEDGHVESYTNDYGDLLNNGSGVFATGNSPGRYRIDTERGTDTALLSVNTQQMQ